MDEEIERRYAELKAKVPQAIAQDADGQDEQKDAVDAFCRWMLTAGLRDEVGKLLDELASDVEEIGAALKAKVEPDEAYIQMLQGCMRAHLAEIRSRFTEILGNQ